LLEYTELKLLASSIAVYIGRRVTQWSELACLRTVNPRYQKPLKSFTSNSSAVKRVQLCLKYFLMLSMCRCRTRWHCHQIFVL